MTHLSRHSLVIAAFILSLTVACGGSKTTTPSSPGGTTNSSGSSLTFKVDGGSTINSSAPTATLANGILTIGGGISGTVLGFALTTTGNGTGTYTFGPLNTANATLLIGNPAASWQGGVGFGSGTITVSSLTSTTVSGTFSFSLTAVQGSGATGTKSVTEGAFNLTFTTTTTNPNPSSSSTISATVDGASWSGSVSRRATLGNNLLTITGQDTNGRVITIVVTVSNNVLVPPTPTVVISLNLGQGNQPIATMVLGSQNWDNSRAGSSGSLTITGLTQTRVTGTFQMGLIASPFNSPPLVNSNITNGVFDLALDRF